MTIREPNRIDRGEAFLSEWRGAMKEGRLSGKWSKALGIATKFKASPAEGPLEETKDG